MASRLLSSTMQGARALVASPVRAPRTVSILLALCLCAFVAIPAAATTVVGTIRDAGGTPVATGTKVHFILSQEATAGGVLYLGPPTTVICSTTSGAIDAGCIVQDNSTLSPAGTYYRVRIVTATGAQLLPERRYTITGATWDIGANAPQPADVLAATSYNQIQEESANLIRQNILNFIGTAVTCVNNNAFLRTDCTFTGGGASSFDAITTGTNVTATMTVGTGGTLNRSGTGTIDASHIFGVKFTNAEALGKIPIGQGDGTAIWADPLVQGLTAHDAVGTSTNPVASGGYASAAAPTDVSADGDIVRLWSLRNGSTVVNLATAGTLYDARQIRALTSSDVVSAQQSGTWTVQPGNTANTTAWLMKLSQTTTDNDVDIATALPTGSNTIGGVNLAQYTPVSGRLPVDGSGVTQPVSGTVTANAGSGTFTVSGTVTANAGTGDFLSIAAHTTNEALKESMAVGGQLDDTATTAATENNVAAARITAQRALHANLRNDAGTEIGTSGAPVRVDPTGTTTQPVSGTVTANAGTNLNTSSLALESSLAKLTLTQGSTTSGQSGPLLQAAVTTSVPSYTTAQTSPLSLDTSGGLRVACITGCGGSGGTAATDNTVFTGGSTQVTPIGAIFDATPPTITDGNVGAPRMDSSRYLFVNCIVGCGASGFADNSAFTFGTSNINVTGAVVDDTATNTVAENSAGAPRMNTNRILYAMNTNSTGTEVGTSGAPLRVDPTGTTVQPVSISQTSSNNDVDVLTVPANMTVDVNRVAGSAVSTAATGVQKVGVVGNSGATLDATVAAGTAPTNAIATLLQYKNTQPAPADTQTLAAQADQAGNQRIAPGMAIATLAAWTSATSVNATQNIFTNSGSGAVLVHLVQTSTLTAGAITFEVSYDNSNWVTIPADAVLDPASTTFAQIALPYTVQASTNKPFLLMGKGWQGLRIKLSTAITGTGSVTPNYALLSNEPAKTLIALSPTAANFNVTVGGSLPTGSNTIGALSANQSVNLNQVAGSSVGTVATGVAKVGVADDAGTAFKSAANALNSTGGGLLASQAIGQFDDTTPTAITENQFGNLRMSANRSAYIEIRDGADNERAANVNASNQLGVEANQATAANLNMRPDTSGATASAPPARANYVGGIVSGATGGLLGGIPVCDSFFAVSITADTQVITGVSGRHVYICHLNLVVSAADNVALVAGTGTTCATSIAGIAGGSTAATGWNFAANGGIALGNGIGAIIRTETTGDNVCILRSSAAQISGSISYVIY